MHNDPELYLYGSLIPVANDAFFYTPHAVPKSKKPQSIKFIDSFIAAEVQIVLSSCIFIGL